MLAVAIIFLLFAVAAGALAEHHPRESSAAERLLQLAQSPAATPRELRVGATEALALGYRQSATALLRRAEFAENVQRAAVLMGQAEPSALPPPEPLPAAPWPEVDGTVWRRYLRSLLLPPDERPPRSGAFGLGPRLLQQLGFMADVHREGEGWAGRWTGILPQEAWLNSLPAQVETVTALTALQRAAAEAVLATAVGQEVEGATATLAGLLAVTLRAGGVKGLQSWLQSPTDRIKFVRTTEAFFKSNGIF